jgi:hypothetical protein
MMFECPCCRQLALDERGHYEICPTCGWEDDPIQAERPEYDGGASSESLDEARRNFAERGTSKSLPRTSYQFRPN